MNQASLAKRPSKKIARLFLMSAILSCIHLAGCSQENQEGEQEKKSDIEDININTLQEVLKHELTGPDQEYVSLLEDAGFLSEGLSDEEIEAVNAHSEELSVYVLDIYEPYFTQNGLEKFIKTNPAYKYHLPTTTEYQMSIADIEVKQSANENAKNQYSFTAQVLFKTTKEESNYKIIGKAIFSEDGKIGDIQFTDTDQLLENKLNSLVD